MLMWLMRMLPKQVITIALFFALHNATRPLIYFLQEQHAAVAAALVIGDGVAEFLVRKTEAARVKLMSVSDDVVLKAGRVAFL